MKLRLLLLSILLICCKINAQWENLNTGINDNLNGVVFFQQNGIVSGENGLYYTTNGGIGSASWTELHNFSNSSSAIFEDTKFTHCYASKTNTTNSGDVYASGQTIIDSRAVLFKINIPTLAYELIYLGEVNTKLNKIDCQDYSTNFVAVGNNGKVIKFEYNTIFEMTPITDSDLVAVSYSSFGNIVFGSVNKIWRCDTYGNTFFSISSTNSSLINNEDIFCSGNSTYSTGDDMVNYIDFSNSTTPIGNTNFVMPLDANSVVLYSGKSFIGTDHGIYKFVSSGSSFQLGCYEFQMSSGSLKFNEFWVLASTATAYACGNNGTLIRTSNGGGATKPYVNINAQGTCVNGNIQFSAVTGSGNSAKWFIDNQLVSTNLAGFNRTFNTVGQYLIRLEVTNSFNETTIVSQYVNIVPIPTINKPIAINDVILCKAETIQITIDNSEPNVKYVLRKEGESNSNYGESPTGNGGTITLNSNLIDLTGNYYIDALSTLATCKRRFDGNFLITVEETKANFHTGAVNAYTNEPIQYFNNSFDAQNFAWQFTFPSGIQNSNTENPQNSYPTSGQVTINLDSWSNNNCHDVITKNGPNIIEPIANPTECMLLINNGVDLPHDGRDDRDDISQISPTTDGFITCGGYNNVIFDSEYGVTHNLPNLQGGYVTKHDKNGVLKWVAYTTASYNGTVNQSNITSCVEDLEGNVYISGFSNGSFNDNSGKIINLTTPASGFATLKDFIIKLNSKGEFIWRIQTTNTRFNKLSIDKQNNIIVNTKNPYYPTVGIYFNGTFVQNIDYTYPWSATYDQNDVLGLLKISPSGTILWNTKLVSDTANGFNNMTIGFDNSNNIYLSSTCESDVDFYSVNNDVKSVFGDGTYGGKFALAKFDSNGNCSWAIRIRTRSSITDNTDGTNMTGYAVDDEGNIYVSGRNECIPNTSQYTHVFENADGTVTETTKGTYYLSKISTNGICQWIRTTTQNVYGNGNCLIKDKNEVFVLGYISSGNSNIISSAEFQSTDNNNYTLTMNRNNYFIAVYDLNGNLKRMFQNTDFNNNFLPANYRGFFRDNQGNFYLARNMYSAEGYVEFGNVMPNLNETDGVIIKFKESCGVPMYLGINENSLDNLNLKLYPNPTSNEFKIDLKEEYSDIALEIYDLYGKIVKKETYHNSKEIVSSICNNSSGIYFIKVKCNENIQWLKLIKN